MPVPPLFFAFLRAQVGAGAERFPACAQKYRPDSVIRLELFKALIDRLEHAYAEVVMGWFIKFYETDMAVAPEVNVIRKAHDSPIVKKVHYP